MQASPLAVGTLKTHSRRARVLRRSKDLCISDQCRGKKLGVGCLGVVMEDSDVRLLCYSRHCLVNQLIRYHCVVCHQVQRMAQTFKSRYNVPVPATVVNLADKMYVETNAYVRNMRSSSNPPQHVYRARRSFLPLVAVVRLPPSSRTLTQRPSHASGTRRGS